MADFRPDFRLDGYQTATPTEEEAFWRHIGVGEFDLSVLAEHHTPQHSFFVCHDGAATWGHPGEPQIVALHLQRDPATRTFGFDHAVLPLAAMAQSWLIARGCPREAIALRTDIGTDPADETTVALQERVIGDGNTYALLTSYTRDTARPVQTAVMLRSLDPGEQQPFRILLETADLDTWQHTLREGAFPTHQAATDWWDTWTVGEPAPLPRLAPAPRSHTTPPSVPASATRSAPPARRR
ncbi:hypothetical protein ACFH04_13510 [Streptomyces noboritoensis]|uniref:Uncharacterized protein n=1 Tax=Streptomyces noboritoensis TaxID=67337 RepID=A0ABV6TFZ4_9ACTN